MYSIIIPTYGTKGIPLVDNLLDSISKFNNPSLDEIIISDDSSNYDTIQGLDILKEKYTNFQKLQIVYNPYLRSFSKTVNRGMKTANPNNDILLLNNDMISLTSFEPFVDFINNHTTNNHTTNNHATNNQTNVGIIGAKLLFPNLRIQHAGIVRIPFIHNFRHRFKFRHYNHGLSNSPEKYIAVTGACFYINRDLINKIGYLDEDYILSYEDIDYCINAQLNGYEVWYIPDVVMIHYESFTRKKSPYDSQNYLRFWSKWSESFPKLDMNIKDEEKIATGAMWLGILRLLAK